MKLTFRFAKVLFSLNKHPISLKYWKNLYRFYSFVPKNHYICANIIMKWNLQHNK